MNAAAMPAVDQWIMSRRVLLVVSKGRRRALHAVVSWVLGNASDFQSREDQTTCRSTNMGVELRHATARNVL